MRAILAMGAVLMLVSGTVQAKKAALKELDSAVDDANASNAAGSNDQKAQKHRKTFDGDTDRKDLPPLKEEKGAFGKKQLVPASGPKAGDQGAPEPGSTRANNQTDYSKPGKGAVPPTVKPAKEEPSRLQALDKYTNDAINEHGREKQHEARVAPSNQGTMTSDPGYLEGTKNKMDAIAAKKEDARVAAAASGDKDAEYRAGLQKWDAYLQQATVAEQELMTAYEGGPKTPYETDKYNIGMKKVRAAKAHYLKKKKEYQRLLEARKGKKGTE